MFQCPAGFDQLWSAHISVDILLPNADIYEELSWHLSMSLCDNCVVSFTVSMVWSLFTQQPRSLKLGSPGEQRRNMRSQWQMHEHAHFLLQDDRTQSTDWNCMNAYFDWTLVTHHDWFGIIGITYGASLEIIVACMKASPTALCPQECQYFRSSCHKTASHENHCAPNYSWEILLLPLWNRLWTGDQSVQEWLCRGNVNH